MHLILAEEDRPAYIVAYKDLGTQGELVVDERCIVDYDSLHPLSLQCRLDAKLGGIRRVRESSTHLARYDGTGRGTHDDDIIHIKAILVRMRRTPGKGLVGLDDRNGKAAVGHEAVVHIHDVVSSRTDVVQKRCDIARCQRIAHALAAPEESSTMEVDQGGSLHGGV